MYMNHNEPPRMHGYDVITIPMVLLIFNDDIYTKCIIW